jgi:hypothetical protein
VYALERTGRDKVGNCLAHGYSADAETYHQGPLGRNCFAGTELGLNQFFENAANLCAFGDGRRRYAITL